MTAQFKIGEQMIIYKEREGVSTVFHSKAKADAIAAANNSDDDDWIYVVAETAEGSHRYKIRVYDETRNYVGDL